MPELPTGTVTFLATDIEGSTPLWESAPEAMKQAVARHDALAVEAIAAHHGTLLKSKSAGDSILAVFDRASDGVAAALHFQTALDGEAWPTPSPIRVRIGIHTGEADLRDGDYYGLALSLCHRLRDAAAGGQTFLSGATEEQVASALPPDASLRNWGSFTLRGIKRAVQIFQAEHPDLPVIDSPPKVEWRTTIPLRLTPFFGREREIEQIEAALRRTRMLTLTGPGGSGKTRLAQEIGEHLLPHFPDGVWFVNLADLRDEGRLPDQLAAAVGAAAQPGETPLQAAKRHLSGQTVLIILDNCEHLLERCAELCREILRDSRSLSILATSRAALGILGEKAWPLDPLPLPAPALSAEEMLRAPSVALFVDRATDADPSFALTERNAPVIAEICRRLDGLPLAIELFARLAPDMTAEEILEGLASRFDLTSDTSIEDQRHQTLVAVLEWDYDLLTEPERVLLRRLSVFAGGWFRQSAAEVCGFGELTAASVQQGLQALRRRSLIVAEDMGALGKRFRMLQTIHDYARLKLAEAGEDDETVSRHALHFLEVAAEAEGHVKQKDPRQWLDRLEADHENLLEALKQTLDPTALLRFAVALHQFWLKRGHIARGRSLVENAVLRAGSVDKRLLARGTNAAGVMAWAQGDLPSAFRLFERALGFCQELNDQALKASILNNLGLVSGQRDEFERARGLLEEALAIYLVLREELGPDERRRLTIDEQVANVLSNLGGLALDLGDYAAARDFSERALGELKQASGTPFAIANTLQNLGAAHRRMRSFVSAGRHLRESLIIREEHKDTRAIALSMLYLSFLMSDLNQPSRAVCLLSKCAAILKEEEIELPANEQQQFDETTASLRDRLGAQHFRRSWAKGEALTMEQAIELGLQAGH